MPWIPTPDNPYTMGDGEEVSDPTAWQLWWKVNQDRFLRYANINTGESRTGSDSFYLGAGQTDAKVGGRLDRKLVQELVVPAVVKGVELGGSLDYVESAMLALGKIGGEENFTQFDFLMRYFLGNGDASINDAAALAIGVMGDARSLDLLTALAQDGSAGRQVLEGEPVPMHLRAAAAYGLGLLASQSDDVALRSSVVGTLVGLLEQKLATNDLQVASVVALGLVPLEVHADAEVCICGECKVEGPERHFQAQVTYLMRYMTADREFDPVVRAHTATTLGRLMEAGLAQVSAELAPSLEEIKAAVADLFVSSLQRYAKQPAIVQQSAVLGLGLLGDADDQETDQWIRHELVKVAGHGDPLQKRFAMMALADVGSRRGTGDNPWDGTGRARAELAQRLSRGKKSEKAWAALALGVMGYQLDLAAQELDPAVDRALEHAAKGARSAGDLGAYALALGLRRADGCSEVLLTQLQKVDDPSARGYTAIGLGLMGARGAIEPLQGILTAEGTEPLLVSRVGLGLGMLGDTQVVGELLRQLETAKDDVDRSAAIASALGFLGDRRAVDALSELMQSKEHGEYAKSRDKAMIALGFMADTARLPWKSALARGCNYLAETPTLTCKDGTGVLDLD